MRFPGQYFDSETGLHYNWHRDYNPETGKYFQSDPIGLDGGLNTFLYVDGNPLSLIDSDGRAPRPTQIGRCYWGAAEVQRAVKSCRDENPDCVPADPDICVFDQMKCRAKFSPDDQATNRWVIICACLKLGGSKDQCIQKAFTACIKVPYSP